MMMQVMRMLMPRLTLVRPRGCTVGWPSSKGTTPAFMVMMVTMMVMVMVVMRMMVVIMMMMVVMMMMIMRMMDAMEMIMQNKLAKLGDAIASHLKP